MPAKRVLIHAGAAVLLGIGLTLGVLSRGSRYDPPLEPEVRPEEALPPSQVRSWKAAASKAEEPRGEAVGRAAAVRVPAELRHYAERRRFLAVQVASTNEHELDLPHDEAELLEMIRRGALVEMEPLGEDYILYGVGANATGGEFAHYDARRGVRITLYDGWADFKDAEAELLAEIAEKKAEVEARQAELRRTSSRARTRRRRLQSQIQGLRGQAAGLEARRTLLASYYEDYERRRILVGEYRLIHEMAADFAGRSYDLGEPGQRRRFRARLLSFVRPEARDLILALAADYKAAFGRPLPVTSLIRTEAYQRQLGRVNPNATTIDSPPHATGLAFDVHYGHMTAAEQNHLMEALARLEAEGRVEALRENRNHFHVFVFPDSQPPNERLIKAALEDVRPSAVSRSRGSGGGKSQVSKGRSRTASSARKAPAKRKPSQVRRAPAKRAPAKKAPTRRPPSRRRR